jgi:hypothetical protein
MAHRVSHKYEWSLCRNPRIKLSKTARSSIAGILKYSLAVASLSLIQPLKVGTRNYNLPSYFKYLWQILTL